MPADDLRGRRQGPNRGATSGKSVPKHGVDRNEVGKLFALDARQLQQSVVVSKRRLTLRLSVSMYGKTVAYEAENRPVSRRLR